MDRTKFEKFLRKSGTWFGLDTVRDGYVSFTTRQHGDMMNDEPGEADLRAGKSLAKELKKEFPEYSWSVDYIDEWTTVTGTTDGPDPSALYVAGKTTPDAMHERIAKRTFNMKMGRSKTAGEIRFVKDRGPDLRDIPSDFEFKETYLQPLSRVMWGLSVAMGHLVTSHSKFTKLKAVNISPDGKLGGKGYIQSIKDMRRDLSEAIETVSESIDTIHDEIRADHWKEGFSELSDEDREEVEETVEEAEDIISDPESFVEDEYDDIQD